MGATLPDPLPNEPDGNWMTAYFYIIEEFPRRNALGEIINDCLRAGHGKPEVEYARDMASIYFGVRTHRQVAKRRTQAMEQAA